MYYKATIIALTLCATIYEANAQYRRLLPAAQTVISGGQRIINAPTAFSNSGTRFFPIGVPTGIVGPAVAPLARVAAVAPVAPLPQFAGLAPIAVSRQAVGPINAAIFTQRSVDVVNVPVPQDVIVPQNLIVEGSLLPVNIEFRSQSSPVNVNQVHIPGPPGTVQQTRSEEEPDILVHEVVKPVIQEVRETITPYRTITQEILPVQETINTLIARGERQQVLAAPAVQQVVAARVAPQVVAAAPVQQVIAGPLPALSAFRSAQPTFASFQPIGQQLVFGGGVGIAAPSRRVVGQPIFTSIKRA